MDSVRRPSFYLCTGEVVSYNMYTALPDSIIDAAGVYTEPDCFARLHMCARHTQLS